MARSGTNHRGGRPKGKKSTKTLEREAVLAHFRQRTMKAADILFNAQLTLACGQTFLYKIEKFYERIGKTRVLRRRRPQQVTAQWEIEAYLEGEMKEGELEDDATTYYFITTKEPSNNAIDSMLDRSVGKSVHSVELTGKDGAPIVFMPVELLEKHQLSDKK